jgi:glycosyltransferase involved in cell wall biosynthesis
MNTYPVTSATFIRREMVALEALGHQVFRFAVRKWDEHLVDPSDVSERSQTHYLLSNNMVQLIAVSLTEPFINPLNLIKTLSLWAKLLMNSGFQVTRHAAYLMQAIYLCRQMKQRGLKHLHVHYSTNACTVALLASKLTGISYSFTTHGPDELDNTAATSLSSKIQYATFVVAISHYCRAQLIRHSEVQYRDKIAIVRCGISIVPPAEHLESTSQNQDQINLVCVGRLCPQKDQLGLLKAFSNLATRVPNLRLTLVGDGPMRAAIEHSILALDLENKVTLTGWVDSKRVQHEISQATTLVLPSLAEGLPIVIMEAMALGKPVISTYIAGIPELVVHGENGWLVPASDTNALEAAILEFIQMPSKVREELGQAARECVFAHHQIENSAVQLANLLAPHC